MPQIKTKGPESSNLSPYFNSPFKLLTIYYMISHSYVNLAHELYLIRYIYSLY